MEYIARSADWWATKSLWWEQLAIMALWLGIVGGLALWVNQHTQTKEWVRKIVHIGAGQVILLAWWMQAPLWMGLLASVLFATLALLSYRYPLLPSLNNVGRKSLGTFFYAISIGLLMTWFWSIEQPQFAVLGVLIMAWGDGLAGVIGQRWGRHPYELWGMKKSWEGSITMAIVTSIVSFALLNTGFMPLPIVLIIALVLGACAAGLEAFSKLGLDNLTVPLGSATIAYALCQYFAIKNS